MNNSIIPGILENDWTEIEKKIEKILSFSRTIHVDLIDGKFVQNTTFLDPKPFTKYAKDAYFELHMMVDEPIDYLKPWAQAGFKRFLGHVEKMSDQAEFIAQGQILGEVGLAIDGPTNIDILSSINLDDLDCLLIYTSEKVGFSGPPFMSDRLTKVKKIREKSQIPIEVDGGINEDTILLAKDAGANRFVSTSFISGSVVPHDQFEKLQNKIV